MQTPVEPPPIKCLFVPFTKIHDYSEKAFKIWQGKSFFFVPKNTVFEILDFGFYVSKYFLTKERKDEESKPPAYQENAWKEFRFDTVCVHQIPQKKTLITDSDDTQADIDRLESEIKSVYYKIRKTVQEFREAKKFESVIRNKIADHYIPEETIRSNKNLLREVRGW